MNGEKICIFLRNTNPLKNKKKLFISSECKVRSSTLKLCLFPGKFHYLQQNDCVLRNSVETLAYWLLIFLFIRTWKVKRNE